MLPWVRVVPYSVLGTQQCSSGGAVQRGPEPKQDTTVILDPAGLPYIQKLGPKSAGGAAGAIYNFLGIKEFPEFPSSVRKAVRKPSDAALHVYNHQPVIHVVGPDFRDPEVAKEGEAAARTRLARTYKNVLKNFLRAGPQATLLRLLPVSGGIFAGPFEESLPRLTFEALDEGFRMLDLPDRLKLYWKLGRCSENDEFEGGAPSGGVEMCIFDEADLPKFEEAFESEISASGEGEDEEEEEE